MFRRSIPAVACFLAISTLATGCMAPSEAAPDESDVEPAASEQAFDSQDGNPTHATHSYMTEVAVDAVRSAYPEVETFRAQLIDGSNRELHDLTLKDARQEALRIDVAGNNWGCAKPSVLLARARASYASGDKATAYWLAGILLHYVEDIGVPAHAFRVVHQASPSNWDQFEVMNLQKWWPLYSTLNRVDPGYADATLYVEWNAAWTRSDFAAAFPGVAYTRTMFPMSWLWASSKHKTFVRERQGRTAMATTWALRSIVSHW